MSILCRPVGRQHKQPAASSSLEVSDELCGHSHNTSRSAFISYPRIKLISESSESKLISESNDVEGIVKFFRILSTMEPKRNNFRCRKPSKRYRRTELICLRVPWRRYPFDVTTLLVPDLLYAVVSHSQLDFGVAQKLKDFTDSKNFCTEILQKTRYFV